MHSTSNYFSNPLGLSASHVRPDQTWGGGNHTCSESLSARSARPDSGGYSLGWVPLGTTCCKEKPLHTENHWLRVECVWAAMHPVSQPLLFLVHSKMPSTCSAWLNRRHANYYLRTQCVYAEVIRGGRQLLSSCVHWRFARASRHECTLGNGADAGCSEVDPVSVCSIWCIENTQRPPAYLRSLFVRPHCILLLI